MTLLLYHLVLHLLLSSLFTYNIIMKTTPFVLALSASTSLLANAFYLPTVAKQAVQQAQQVLSSEKYLVETSPGVISWITEDDKWELRRQGINFMDITDTAELGLLQVRDQKTFTFPNKTSYNETIHPMLKNLSATHMEENLQKFTSFHTRYYKSDSGAESSKWLLNKVNETVAASGAHKYGATVEPFIHPWGQHSVIARIPGRTNKTVVIGAHQDSINLFLPYFLAAPGADDDGSGTVTILEALRVLLQSKDVVHGKAENTIEFMWYSAEEGGLLGSQAIFAEYERQGRDVRAMLQQDMTGYIQKTLDAGLPESVGVITDFVNPDLTEFIKKVIVSYCDIPYVLTKCGYACSDHASASKAGYPSAFVIEVCYVQFVS